MINLFSSRQEIRGYGGQFVLGSQSGGGGGVTFALGTEVFQFNSNQTPGSQPPRRILSMWVDASGLTTGKNLVITTPFQTFTIAGGTPGGYIVLIAPVPFTITFSTNAGTGTIFLIAYEFNALFVGAPGARVAGAGGGTGGSGGTGGGGGGGFAETGGSGGGRPTF